MNMQKRGAASAVGIVAGFVAVDGSKVLETVARERDISLVGMYRQFAALGNLSARLVDRIIACGELNFDAFAAAYFRDVDQELGARIAHLFIDERRRVTVDGPEVRAMLCRLASYLFDMHDEPAPRTRDSVAQLADSTETVGGPAVCAVAIADGMALGGRLDEGTPSSLLGLDSEVLLELADDVAGAAVVSSGIQADVHKLDGFVDVRGADDYHLAVDRRFGEFLARMCRRECPPLWIASPLGLVELARIAQSYFGAAKQPCALVREVILDWLLGCR